jgi:hypothetical protein
MNAKRLKAHFENLANEARVNAAKVTAVEL